MREFLLYFAFAFIALSVQAIFFKGIKPDILLVLVCYYTLRYGQIKGTVYGALSGLLMDTASGTIVGPHVISKAFSAVLAGTVKDNIFQWNVLVNMLAIIALSVVNILIIHLCLGIFADIPMDNRPFRISFLETIYTVVFSLVLYFFFRPVKGNGNA